MAERGTHGTGDSGKAQTACRSNGTRPRAAEEVVENGLRKGSEVVENGSATALEPGIASFVPSPRADRRGSASGRESGREPAWDRASGAKENGRPVSVLPYSYAI